MSYKRLYSLTNEQKTITGDEVELRLDVQSASDLCSYSITYPPNLSEIEMASVIRRLAAMIAGER